MSPAYTHSLCYTRSAWIHIRTACQRRPRSHIGRPSLLKYAYPFSNSCPTLRRCTTALLRHPPQPVFSRYMPPIYAAKIVEAHLASGALHHYTCALIRLFAYLRSGIIPPGVSRLNDYINLCIHETTQNRFEPPKWTRPPLRLVQPPGAAAVSASALRGILASHHRSERLVAGCLHTYLPRFRVLGIFARLGSLIWTKM